MASTSSAAERKSERLELRVTPSTKKIIQRASALSGLTAGDLAFEAARRILDEQEVWHLSAKDSLAVANALLEPPEPSEALVTALRHRQELFE